MENKEKYVYQVFESIADGYDSANLRISAGQHLKWKKTALDLFVQKLPDNPCVLDSGCGTGDMILLLRDRLPMAELTGLDFSPNMLKVAHERCKNDSRINLTEGNAMELPFPDAAFDGVTISFALRNTGNYRTVLQEIWRVLKPEGVLLVIDSFVPQNPLIRPFYRLYFRRIMPVLGGRRSHRRQYEWLSRSTEEFISVNELKLLVNQTGLSIIQTRSFMFGASACVIAKKGDV